MIKQALKKVFSALKLWQYFVLSVSLAAISSCGNQPSPKPQNAPAEKQAVPVQNDIKSFPPPRVTTITSANAPKIIKAGTPVKWADSLNAGAPFFTNFGPEQGLALSRINCSLQDKSGNIWFGTQGGGASRYDGKRFTNFTSAQGLGGNTILDMMQDKDGNIWFGTSGGGASRYDGKGFTKFTMAQGLPGNIVGTVMQDKAGNIWFGTDGGGVSRYDGKKFTNYNKEQGLAGKTVISLLQDKSGDIWMGTYLGISRYNGKGFTNYNQADGLPGNDIICMMQDNTGNVWFGTDGGLSYYDGKHFVNYTKAAGLAGNVIQSMAQDKEGNIWVGTPTGVSYFDGKKFTSYTIAQGLTDNNIQTVLRDRSGSIWFGNGSGGVSRYDGNSLTGFTPPHGLVGNFGNKIFQDNAGNLWFGTDGAGVICYDGKTFKNYTTIQGLLHNSVTGIMQDREGNLWFSTWAGVSRYDGKTFTNYTTIQGLGANGVQCAMQDRSGKIWFGTWAGGVSCFDGKSFTTYTTAQGLAFNIVDVIIQDKTGNIWFGSGGGVSRYDGKSFANFTASQGLVDNVIISGLQARSGDIWFGTGEGGASRYNGKNFINNSPAQWLENNGEVYAIAEDPKRGRIWFGTTLGLSWLKTGTFNISETAGLSSDVLDLGAGFGMFDPSTGYPIQDVNAICIDNKGIIWTECGNNKIIRFDDNSLVKDSTPSNLAIENIKVNGENICWNNLAAGNQGSKPVNNKAMLTEMVTTFGKTLSPTVLDSMHRKYNDIKFDSIGRFYPVPVNLTLPYADRNLTFNFVAIAPDQNNQVRYTYKLEGYDKNWSVPGNSTTAVFGNIPEGDYTFRLTALSRYKAPSEITYKFTILPPWYRAWWAWIVYVIAAGAGIWGIAHYRSRHLVRQKRELEHEVDVRTEQVLQQKEEIESQRDNLEITINQLKDAQTQLIQSEKMASLGELATGIAHEIQNPLNFVNNFSELNREMIAELEEELKTGNVDEALAIAADLKQNEDKITHHGKRAGSIVKGMLEHSSNVGHAVKEETDINRLIGEYIRITYQAWQAKDKSFKAEIIINEDAGLPNVKIIQQEMGKVLLNLLNNAFYAVNEKRKSTSPDYEPEVIVTTLMQNGHMIIKVKDNGTGIPDSIRDKIMQPFFTTKPTGEGTGLGLSLTYDIVVKSHGGNIHAESHEGDYSEFIVSIPL